MRSERRWLSTGMNMPCALSQLSVLEFEIYTEERREKRGERDVNRVTSEDTKALAPRTQTGKQPASVFACARASLGLSPRAERKTNREIRRQQTGMS